MTRVAVIEDDLPTSNQLAGWIRAARPQVQVDQWFDRDSAEAVSYTHLTLPTTERV